MKKLIGCFCGLLLVLSLVTGAVAEECVQGITWLSQDKSAALWVLDCTDDATNNIASVAMTDTIFSKLRGYFLYQATVDPGATLPDANYDIVLTVAGGTTNLLGTDLSALSQTLTLKTVLSSTLAIDELLYFATTDQTVDSALFTVEFLCVK